MSLSLPPPIVPRIIDPAIVRPGRSDRHVRSCPPSHPHAAALATVLHQVISASSLNSSRQQSSLSVDSVLQVYSSTRHLPAREQTLQIVSTPEFLRMIRSTRWRWHRSRHSGFKRYAPCCQSHSFKQHSMSMVSLSSKFNSRSFKVLI